MRLAGYGCTLLRPFLTVIAVAFGVLVTAHLFYQLASNPSRYPLARLAEVVTRPLRQPLLDNFPLAPQGIDLSPFIVIGIVILVWSLLRQAANRMQEFCESEVRRWTAPARPQPVTPPPRPRAATEAAPPAGRTVLIEQFMQIKKSLAEAERDLAFLSVDVVGSAAMKRGQDKLVTEHAFLAYRKLAEGVVKAHKPWKAAWTPDGLMVAFSNPDDAVEAGKELLESLPGFNREAHMLAQPFRVRGGASFGRVYFEETARLTQVSDELIDLAGHLQKEAPSDSIVITQELYKRLTTRHDFSLTTAPVSGVTAYQWTVPREQVTVEEITVPPDA